jgi:SAM-dependent methyltransferase
MGIAEEWWQTFFRGVFVDCWLRVPSEEQTRQEADFLQEALRVDPPAKLLDVPCGGGRHSFALAARGFRMTGVDLSEGFLDAARARAASLSESDRIAWEHREMRDLPWREEFDGAYCFGNSFGYLDDLGNGDFLKAVARALRPGARFVLDTSYVAEVLFPSLQERAWYPVGEMLFLADRRYVPAESRLHVEYTFIRAGETEKRSMSARVYTCREIHSLLKEAGFTDVQDVGALNREPFRLGSSRLLLVATRKAG